MQAEYKQRPSVVVIIPFYNGSDWIERAIKSVVNQTVPADEFIIVNDGSKPEERIALEKLAEIYPFHIVDKANGGQGSARNAGVKSSTSQFISFLDQDDYYFPDHIRDLVEAIPERDSRLGFVYADLAAADGPGNILHSHMLSPMRSMHPKRGHIAQLLRHDLFILPSASLIKREAFEAISGFDEQFMGYEDDDLFLRMFRAGFTNHFIETPVTAWCQHKGSTSWSIKMSRSRWKYFKKLVTSFPDDEFTGTFYFRDCFVPRFQADFIKEAAHAVRDNSEHRQERLDILSEFVRMVDANPSISKAYKRKLNLMTFALNSVPLWALRLLRKGTGLPFVRRLVA
jgi:glycosyltransferase involved in cell wall biosynthesis